MDIFGDIEGKFLQFPLPVLPVWLCRRQSAKASKTFAAGNAGAGGMYTTAHEWMPIHP